ncbi:MAG: hypothetical protein ABSG13_14700 [Bryobacteraceae bacterium]|jgi:hypothetical protein
MIHLARSGCRFANAIQYAVVLEYLTLMTEDPNPSGASLAS